MKMAHLGSVAKIALGHSFRTGLSELAPGPGVEGIRVIQAKDLGDQGAVNIATAVVVSEDALRSSIELRENDILFQPRGVTYRAALVAVTPEPIVAAAPLFILRADRRWLDPAYLTSFLNDPATQAVLRQKATGTRLPQVSRGALEELEVPLPPLSKQAALGSLAQLINTRRRLEQQINDHSLTLLRALASGSASKKPKAR